MIQVLQKIIKCLLCVLLSLTIVFFFQDWINEVAKFLSQEQVVTIQMLDTEENNGKTIQLLCGDDTVTFPKMKEAAEKTDDWTYFEGEEGVSWTCLETTIKGAELTFKIEPRKNPALLFHMSPINGQAKVIVGNDSLIIDCYKMSDASLYNVPLFQNKQYNSVARSSLLVFCFGIAFVVFYFSLNHVRLTDLKGKISISKVLFLAILSFFFVCSFKDTVNQLIIYDLLPTKEVTIRTEKNAGIIISTGDKRNPLTEKDRVLERGEDEKGFYSICQMTCVPEAYVRIEVSEEDNCISYVIDGVEHSEIVSEKESKSGYYFLYPFASSTLKVGLSILIYLLICVLITFFLVLVHVNLCDKDHCRGFLYFNYKRSFVWLVFIGAVVYSTALFQYVYQIDLPHYIPDNALGDQLEYWNTYLFKNGDFNYDAEFKSFRGYSNFLLPSISQFIGAKLGVDSVKIYLLFPAFAFAWLTTIVVPWLYTLFCKKEPKTISIIVFFLVFSYFHRQYFTMVTTDFYNNVLFFTSILFFVLAFKKQSFLCAVIFGFATSFMINMHYNFGVYYLLIALGYALFVLINYKPTGRQLLEFLKRNTTMKRVLCFLLALLCFITVCVPQINYNMKSGHKGLFPYDSKTAFNGHPVSWNMWNTFLTHGLVLWPKFIGDDQLDTMKTQLYEKTETLNPIQAMDVYANSPIETAVAISKKVFIMFDKKTNVNYSTEITWRETKGLVFSFFNYLVLLIGLFVLLKRKLIPLELAVFSWLTFFATVMTRMPGHIEHRSSMTFYILLCMFFSFQFIGEIASNKERYKEICDAGMYKMLAFGELLCYGISMTIWA